MLRLEILIRRQQRLSSETSSGRRSKAHVIVTPTFCGTATRYQTLLQTARAVSPPALSLKVSTPTEQNADRAIGITHRREPLPCSTLEARSRGAPPDTVPPRPPESKLPHPQERVHLRHASLPKSRIPVPVRPRRLVELKHWSPSKAARTESQAAAKPLQELRRKGSVKDLVRCFEGLEKECGRRIN